ncbi:hypothetical protein PENSPDRAFT_275595 [Peniophora sp. CONT]|nr:hypothetical protein PENSPDRAFT_275595 [Peniophora sp. CONT]
MPKDEKQYSHYATRNGREGPHIYTSWPECDKNTKGVPGVEWEGFYSLEAAEKYLSRGARLKAIRRALSENGPLLNVSNVVVKTDALIPEKDSPVQVVEVKAKIKEEVMADVVQEVCATISVVAESLKAEDVGDVAGAVESIINSETVPVKENDANPSQEEQPAPKEHWTCCDPQPSKAELAEDEAPVGDLDAPPPILLSDEQVHIRDLVRSGRNVFFTGSAGT